MKRILALLLCTVLLLTVFPVSASADKTEPKEDEIYVYTEADNALIDEDVFASIEEVKLDAAEACGGIGRMKEQDYIALIPQVIEKIENSATYVPGTLQQNGYFLVWMTTVGIPCCYDPRMEEELHNTENEPTPEEIALAEAQADAILQTVDELCGGGPNGPDIGLIQPYWESSSNYADSSFNNYSPQYKAMWQALYQTTGGSGLRYSMSNANVDNIGATMSQCGLVMFDSHGTTDYSGSGGDYTSRANSSYLCLTTNAGVTSEDTASHTGSYGTYYDCLKGSGYAYVNGQCIANHMPTDAPNSYLYMGICLGMATDRMCVPLRAKGVEVVYGYSQSVTFAGDMDYMNNLNTSIKNGDDMGTAVANMKAAVGCPDPYTSSRPAWPIVASSEDPYPGHGNVDQAQTVYSTWSLFGTNFEVTAVSNNETWGTVTVLGSNITAHPAEGYYAAGYELVSGTATVTQNGNVFRVQAESDCTVKIIFAAKTPAVVNYYANGTSVGSENSYLSDDVVLPLTAPEIFGYRFRGWVEAPVYETNEKPDFYKPGASYTVLSANVNLYALYSCVIGGGGIAYRLVTEEPDDWEGNYVISGSKTGTIYVLKGLSSGSNYESSSNGSVIAHTDAGMELDEDLLREVDDAYIWVVEASGSGYTIQNLDNETYLGSSGYSLYSLGSGSDAAARWTITYVANTGTKAANEANSSYPYLTFYNNNVFALYGLSSFNQYPVQFWKETEDGETFYYTEITPHEHELVYVEAVQPTCTENGNIAHWRCSLCGKCFSDAEGENEIPAASVVLPANGHTSGDPVIENETQPTCGEDGGYDTVVYCTVCLAQVSRTHTVVPATGEHSYGDWSSNNNGTHSRVCGVCNGVDTENCAYEDAVTPPTPADQGYTTHTCAVCGYSFNDSFVPALGFDYTVHFAVPEGVEQPEDMVSNTNTGITLPMVSAPEGYFFLGWVTDTYSNVTDKPAEVLTGNYIAPEDITLNALFLHYEGGETSYVLLTSAPADWTGNYLITYGADAAYVMKGIEAGKSYEDKKNGGAAPLADTGIVLNGDTLTNVPADYVFAAEAHGSVYSFRSVTLGSYLADRKLSQSYTLRSAEAYADDCGWKPSVASGVVTLKSPVVDANRSVLSFYRTGTGSSYYFRAYSTVDNIRLWQEHNTGTPLYTTVLEETAHEHTPGEAVVENDVPATCTEPGSYDLVVYCTECGEELSRETVTVDALGHDYAAVVTEPTCLDGGYTTFTCTRCGDSFVDNEIDALGHAWDEGTVVTEPTETEPGVKRYTCTRCGAVRDEEIPAEPHDCPCKDFEDMPEYGTPEHEAIDWAYTHGITKGVTATQFGVGKTLTRAQAATFLYAAAGKPEFDAEHAANPFSDVPAGAWFTNPVLWAASEGIVSGYSDGTFKPNGTLSRAQILVILYAQAGKPDVSGYENPYSDVPASGWFTNAALWAYYEGIERGEDGVFAQSTPCTREVFVLYLYRNMTGSCLLGDE